MPVKTIAAAVAGAMVALLVGLFLGEYEFEGTMPYLAGPLFGMVLGEIMVSLAGKRSIVIGVLCGLFAGGALLLGGALDANNVEPIKTGAYAAAGLGLVVGYGRAGVVSLPASDD